MHKMVEYIKMLAERKIVKKANSQEVIKFINEKWINQTCPMCRGNRWTVSEKIFELREFNDGNIVLGGPNSSIMPVIPVTCESCGNTIFINALSSGLLKE